MGPGSSINTTNPDLRPKKKKKKKKKSKSKSRNLLKDFDKKG